MPRRRRRPCCHANRNKLWMPPLHLPLPRRRLTPLTAAARRSSDPAPSRFHFHFSACHRARALFLYGSLIAACRQKGIQVRGFFMRKVFCPVLLAVTVGFMTVSKAHAHGYVGERL